MAKLSSLEKGVGIAAIGVPILAGIAYSLIPPGYLPECLHSSNEPLATIQDFIVSATLLVPSLEIYSYIMQRKSKQNSQAETSEQR